MTPQAGPLKQDRQQPYWGQIMTPRSGKRAPHCAIWCADNGSYSGAFDWTCFSDWLCFMQPWRNRCVFVVAPDVVANAVATLDLFRWYAWRIQSLGFPVALVAQDGLEALRWPPAWAYDALFVGGTTAWKLSAAADWCIRRAMQAGKWVHVGRVNSQRRIRHFQLLGVHSVDGTSLAYSPDRHYKRFSKQLAQPPLFQLSQPTGG
jgi:hypothetical protein